MGERAGVLRGGGGIRRVLRRRRMPRWPIQLLAAHWRRVGQGCIPGDGGWWATAPHRDDREGKTDDHHASGRRLSRRRLHTHLHTLPEVRRAGADVRYPTPETLQTEKPGSPESADVLSFSAAASAGHYPTTSRRRRQAADPAASTRSRARVHYPTTSPWSRPRAERADRACGVMGDRPGVCLGATSRSPPTNRCSTRQYSTERVFWSIGEWLGYR